MTDGGHRHVRRRRRGHRHVLPDLRRDQFTGGIPESWARNMAKLERLEIQGIGMEFDVD